MEEEKYKKHLNRKAESLILMEWDKLRKLMWSENCAISPGGFIGIGIDLKMMGQSSVSTMVGLELLPLNEQADGQNSYSGFLIHLSFNRQPR